MRRLTEKQIAKRTGFTPKQLDEIEHSRTQIEQIANQILTILYGPKDASNNTNQHWTQTSHNDRHKTHPNKKRQRRTSDSSNKSYPVKPETKKYDDQSSSTFTSHSQTNKSSKYSSSENSQKSDSDSSKSEQKNCSISSSRSKTPRNKSPTTRQNIHKPSQNSQYPPHLNNQKPHPQQTNKQETSDIHSSPPRKKIKHQEQQEQKQPIQQQQQQQQEQKQKQEPRQEQKQKEQEEQPEPKKKLEIYENTDSFGNTFLDTDTMVTKVNLNKISIELTPEEKKRINTYEIQNVSNKEPGKHDYINTTLYTFMFRCSIGTCKYNIINPHNTQQSILKHCEQFHCDNKILYEYDLNYSRATEQFLYDRTNSSLQKIETPQNSKPKKQ